MMNEPLESTIKRAVQKVLKRRDHCFFFKMPGTAAKLGLPDFIVCYRGFFLAFELKRPGRVFRFLTKLQEIILGKIRDAGGIAKVVTSSAEVTQTLDMIDSWEIIRH